MVTLPEIHDMDVRRSDLLVDTADDVQCGITQHFIDAHLPARSLL